MAMSIDVRRLGLAIATSGLILIGLAYLANFDLPKDFKISPRPLFYLLSAHIIVIISRGMLMRALAPVEIRNGVRSWISLSARHQLIFSIFPTGLGDLGYPHLAKQTVKMEVGEAILVIAKLRLRDSVFLVMMAVVGLFLINTSIGLEVLLIFPLLLTLWFVDEIGDLILRLVASILPFRSAKAILNSVPLRERVSIRDRALRSLLAALVWIASTLAAIAAFQSIGQSLTIGEALVLIAMINAAGLVSISIAGFGVSEMGAATALVISGRGAVSAASIALIVRPLLLLSVVVSCVSLIAVITIINYRVSSKP